jgi:hypothetical protein
VIDESGLAGAVVADENLVRVALPAAWSTPFPTSLTETRTPDAALEVVDELARSSIE